MNKPKNILALMAVLISSVTSAAEKQPNILLILADDLGWADTTLYGKTSLYETPNIQRLADRGMVFTNAYSNPICSPTRASIISGQNAARHGMTQPAGHLADVRLKAEETDRGRPEQKSTNVRSATRIDPAMPTLGTVLRNAGYATAHFGKWHLGKSPYSPLEFGFDIDLPHWHGPGPRTSYLAPWGYSNPDFREGEPGDHIEDRMAQEAVAWLKKRDKTKPFFMNYWQFSVHGPFDAKPELIEKYRKKIKRGDRHDSATYAAMVESLDDAVGTLLDALEEEDLLENTIIVFYSDNGGNMHSGVEEIDKAGEEYMTTLTDNHPLRGGKGNIHEGGIRVPAFVIWPGVTKPGASSDTRIQANDLYPTILRMLDVKGPSGHVIDGVDFTKALRGRAMDRGPMFTYAPYHGNTPNWVPPSMAVHHGDWKLIRIFHYGEDGAHEYRLYNLKEDIGENHNLAAKHPDKVEAMDKLIEDYIAEAKVAVPLPNANFDPAKFDPKSIGVQKGGLKISKSKKSKPKATKAPAPVTTPAPVARVKEESLLGWVVRGARVSVSDGRLEILPSGAQPFLAHTGVRSDGSVEITLRIRSKVDGKARLQWRTEGQDKFPKEGQGKSFELTGGDWQELKVVLPVESRLVHLRFFPPKQKQAVEIDWIELSPRKGPAKETQRWDFGAMPTNTPKPRAQSMRAENKPNIILILADDLGYGESGCYDGPVKTPHMDGLAKKGVRCTDGYAAFPVCSPSRAALMTGRYPHRYGPSFEDYYGGGSPELDPVKHPTIAQLLKETGYRNGCFGKWNVSNLNRTPANAFGFDSWVGLHLNHDFYSHQLVANGELDMFRDGKPYPDRAGSWSDTVFADEAIKFIKTESEKPFFIYLPFQAPHDPIQDPDVPNAERLSKKDPKSRPTLVKMVERLDSEIGRVLKALEEEGVADNTLVIMTSDNGGAQIIGRNLPLGGGKQMLQEGGIRVPLILSWPGVLPEGKEFSTPVSAYDLTATIAAAGGAKARPDKPFDGVDLVPAMTGKGELAEDRPLFFRRRNVVAWKGENVIRQSAVRQGDWKLLRTYDKRNNTKFKTALYNLKNDIAEETDLAAVHPGKTEALSQLLEQWEAETAKTAEPLPPVQKRKNP